MNEDNLYHLGFNPKEIRGEFAILPGDPGRIEQIAAHFTDAVPVSYRREFNIWRGFADAGRMHPVFLCSTGIGGPSAAIAVEDMAGVTHFNRSPMNWNKNGRPGKSWAFWLLKWNLRQFIRPPQRSAVKRAVCFT